MDALHPALGSYEDADVPVIVRGEGAYIYDANGKRYLDGLAGLFVSQLGHGRTDLAEAAAKQAEQLAFMPLWSYAHPKRDRARRAGRGLRARRPEPRLLHQRWRRGRRDRVEARQELLQAHRQADEAQGDQPHDRLPRHHPGRAVDHRAPGLKQQFEPLVPSTFRVPNTNFYRAPEPTGAARRPRGLRPLGRRPDRRQIENEGPDTVAAVFLEPVQNAGGCFPPPPGYFQRVREICDEYDVLLVSDEVICAFGRLGHMFGAERYGYQPDMITCAKGITSGYAPLGAMIASDQLMEPFLRGRRVVRARLHLRRPPGLDRGRDGEPRRLREREHPRERPRQRGRASARPSSGSRTCRSSATSAATGTSTASSWSRTRRPRRPSTTRSASACSAASSPSSSTPRASTAAPTTAATRSSSSRRR